MKIFVRERARARRIPVIMVTSDRGMIDIERFDLEPERPLLHGLLMGVRSEDIKGLTTKEKVPYVLRLIGQDGLSARAIASLFEIEQSVSSWPQLASSVALGGATATDTARRVLLDQFRGSGRYLMPFEALIREGAEARTTFDSALEDALRERPALSIEVPELRPRGGGGAITEEEIRTIVAHGVLAPSAGNAQPWRFSAKGGRIRGSIDESREWVFLDFERSSTYVAMGAAAENMVLAAGAMGLCTEVRLLADPAPPSAVYDLSLTRVEGDPGPPPPLAAAIAKRVTNRKHAARSPLADSAVSALEAAAAEAGGKLMLVRDSQEIDAIGAIVGGVDRIMYLSERLHHELTSELRWSQAEVERTCDGIDVATAELAPADLAGLRLLTSWPGMEFLRGIGGGGALEKAAKDAFSRCSAAGLLVMPGAARPETYFRGGRALARLWLTATSLKLGIHPMSASVYLFARLERGRGQGFSEDQARALEELRRRYLSVLPVMASAETEILLFRISDASPPRVRSLRRPVDDVLSFD
jgi:nitroreductase